MTDDDDPPEGAGTGYHRLAGELTSFTAEFETLVEDVTADGDTAEWVRRGRELLEQTRVALDRGEIEQGWQYLHAAKRFRFFGLDATEAGNDALHAEARQLILEAEHAAIAWRATAIRERLANKDGTIRETVTANDLRAAQELLHDGYQRVHLKRQHLQSQFRYLRLWAGATIVALVLVALVSPALDFVPTPLLDFGETTSANPGGFLVYVALSGMLGGALFGLRSIRRHSVSGSTPQYLSARHASVARVLVGAGSAVAVFFFLRSELLTVDVGAGVKDGPFLLSMGFVAGYSERLVHTTVESVAGMTETASNGSDDS